MTTKKKRLGRGLEVLLSKSIADTASVIGVGKDRLRSIPLELFQRGQYQPRVDIRQDTLEDLATSIKSQGVIQPIIARPLVRTDDEVQRYEIIAGERRWRAAALAGLSHVPVVIKDLSEAEVLKIALIENIQREDLDPLEEAQAFSGLIREFDLTQDQVAKSVGKNRATVANALRLLKLPDHAMELLSEGKITAGHARAIMTLPDEAGMERLAKEIAQAGLSVRDAEARARKMKAAEKKQSSPGEPAHATRAVEERLMRRFGTKIRLVERRGKGRIEIAFHSLDQLEDLLSRLDP